MLIPDIKKINGNTCNNSFKIHKTRPIGMEKNIAIPWLFGDFNTSL